jgi:hypothetical protein
MMIGKTAQPIIPHQTVVVCRFCNWPFIPRQSNPRQCPRCRHTNWDSGIRYDTKEVNINKLKWDFIFNR